MAKKISILPLCIFAIVMLALLSSTMAIKNNKVTRVFDMNGPNVKQVTSIEFVNDGEQDLESYILLVASQFENDLIQIEAKIKEDSVEVVRQENMDLDKHIAFKAIFDTPLKAGSEHRLIVTEEYVNRKVPFPNRLKITDTPRVRITGKFT